MKTCKSFFVNKNRPIFTPNQKVHMISSVQSTSVYCLWPLISLNMQDIIQIRTSKTNLSYLFHKHIRSKKISHLATI